MPHVSGGPGARISLTTPARGTLAVRSSAARRGRSMDQGGPGPRLHEVAGEQGFELRRAQWSTIGQHYGSFASDVYRGQEQLDCSDRCG
ncbi:unnamed protein product [Linum tenue]|uniref:Uncharacterized protein n=1 Tax=Linum tenue TaxID=586396 RepID=A0AAV0QW83_9ROSI|nr:unnamed protein product [Linum tenue]